MRATQAKRYVAEVKRKNKRLDQNTLKLITGTAEETNRKILKRGKPDLKFPVRSLSNVSYSKKSGYLEIGKQKKVRTLTVSTVKTFAQTLRMMSLSKDLIESNDFATKRDAYYQSKNWGDAGFQEQTRPTRSSTMTGFESSATGGIPQGAAFRSVQSSPKRPDVLVEESWAMLGSLLARGL